MLDEGRVVSGSSDRMLSIWRISDGVCERVLGGHNGTVWSVCTVADEKGAGGPQ